MPLRILNAFSAALFLVLALVSVAFWSAGRDGFGTGQPNGGGAAAWAALFALFAMLCFVNLRRAGGSGAGRWLLALNAAAALAMIAGAVLIAGARILCGAAALPFALTALLLAARRRPRA